MYVRLHVKCLILCPILSNLSLVEFLVKVARINVTVIRARKIKLHPNGPTEKSKGTNRVLELLAKLHPVSISFVMTVFTFLRLSVRIPVCME